ncbi:hypothetical protein IQ62_00110, partial [Streptomyces scabiei]
PNPDTSHTTEEPMPATRYAPAEAQLPLWPDPTPALTTCTCTPPTTHPCGHCTHCDTCLDCDRCAGADCTCECEED